jgi:hypothetical protein
MQQLTGASSSRVLFCTLADLGDCLLYTPNLHKCAQNGRKNLRRQLGSARSCRSRTGFSKLKRSAQTHSSSHRCFRRRQTNLGIRRTRSRAKSLVPSHSVSSLTWKFVFRESNLFLILIASADGRALVAVGCAKGVWIGFRHDSRCEDRVAVCHIVTQPTCSHAQSAAHQHGHTMCNARRFWDLPRARRQSKLHFRSHTLDDLIGD